MTRASPAFFLGGEKGTGSQVQKWNKHYTASNSCSRILENILTSRFNIVIIAQLSDVSQAILVFKMEHF